MKGEKRIRGEKNITDLLDLSKCERRKPKGEGIRRKAIKPKGCVFISPFDCLNTLVKKYNTPQPDSINQMCISFILKNINEVSIKGNTCAEIMTDHIFIKKRGKRSDIKRETSPEQTFMGDLEEQLSYHVTNEGYLPMFGLVLDPREMQLSQKMEKQFFVKIFNFNSEEVVLHSNTHICKIYIYISKKSAITN